MAKRNFVDVDTYQARTTLEQAAADCDVPIQVTGSGQNVRIDCSFSCEGDHCGKREIAVDTENPAKQWQCHAYGCGARGNLLQLMYGWLTGEQPPARLRSDAFTIVRDRIKETMQGSPTPTPLPVATTDQQPATEAPQRNTPLLRSGDSKTRSLMEPPIWEKGAAEIADMAPAPSAYVRRHRCLSPEAMAKWHVFVLPSDGGGDKRGFSLRNKITYPFLSEDDQVLGFVSRDPKYEENAAAFERIKPEERDPGKRPAKHHFPKGFKRGLELYGQQRSRLDEAGYREAIARYGIIVVEGFNDVIRLDSDGIPAIAICSNLITDEQVGKLVRWSRVLETHVSLMFDCDEEGDRGAADAAWKLLQTVVDVRAAWGRAMYDGQFAGRQPESVDYNELHSVILKHLGEAT